MHSSPISITRIRWRPSSRPSPSSAPTAGRIGVEKKGFGTLSISAYEQLLAGLAGTEVVDGSGIVERFRAIKSPAEIAHIRTACRIASTAVRAAAEHCRAGVSEQQLAGHVDKVLAENGSEYAGLPLLLSSGDRTYIRHAVPADKIIDPGDNVLVELTGVVWRYAGPLFRTISIGGAERGAARPFRCRRRHAGGATGGAAPGSHVS